MLRTVIMGTPDFAVPIFRQLAATEKVIAIFTQPDRPAGRGRLPAASPIKREAAARGIPVYQPGSLRRQPEVVQALRALKPILKNRIGATFKSGLTWLGLTRYGERPTL